MIRLTESLATSFFVLEHYVSLLLLVAPAWALGRRLLRRVPFSSGLAANSFAVGIGLGSLATALMGLALLHLFRPPWIVALLLASQLFAWTAWRDAPRELRSWLSSESDVRTILVAVAVAIVAAPLLVLPLYPPDGFDPVMFHLPFARAIVDAGGIAFFESLRYPVFPALAEVLYALALVTGDDLLPALLHTTFLVLVALLLYAWGCHEGRRRVGLWAALLWIGSPVAVYTGVVANVDCALAFFGTATLFSLSRLRSSREPAWLYLAGVCAAFAAATKYHGLFFVAVFSAWALVWMVRERRWRRVAVTASLALLPLLPFYGPIVANTGNPVFPFASDIFGMSQWTFELSRARLPVEVADPLHLTREEVRAMWPEFEPRSVRFRARRLRTLVEECFELFTAKFPFGGRPISPLFALLLPFALSMAFLSAAARVLLMVLGGYLICWHVTARDPRYLLAVLPVLALLSSQGLDRFLGWFSRPTRVGSVVVSGLVATVLVLAAAATPAEISRKSGALPIDQAGRDGFLTRSHPVYPALQFINQLGAERTYAFFLENVKFYARGELLGDWIGPYRYRVAFRLGHALPQLAKWLRSVDCEYLMMAKPRRGVPRRAPQRALPDPRLLPEQFELVYEDDSAAVYRVRTEAEVAAGTENQEPAADAAQDPRR